MLSFVGLSVRPCFRPSVRPSVLAFVRRSVRPSLLSSVGQSVRPCFRSSVGPSVLAFVRHRSAGRSANAIDYMCSDIFFFFTSKRCRTRPSTRSKPTRHIARRARTSARAILGTPTRKAMVWQRRLPTALETKGDGCTRNSAISEVMELNNHPANDCR